MTESIIHKLNSFSTFKFDSIKNRIVNMKFQEETNIDEFLSIQHILDVNKIMYIFDKNFEIQLILGEKNLFSKYT